MKTKLLARKVIKIIRPILLITCTFTLAIFVVIWHGRKTGNLQSSHGSISAKVASRTIQENVINSSKSDKDVPKDDISIETEIALNKFGLSARYTIPFQVTVVNTNRTRYSTENSK